MVSTRQSKGDSLPGDGGQVNPKELLRTAETILVIDWPSRDVPEALVLAGSRVVVRGGPGPEDYSAYEWKNGEVLERRTGREPARADLVYTYRPLSELPGIIELAKRLGARAIWWQSGVVLGGANDAKGCWAAQEELVAARNLVAEAGLKFVSEPYIGDAARELRAGSAR